MAARGSGPGLGEQAAAQENAVRLPALGMSLTADQNLRRVVEAARQGNRRSRRLIKRHGVGDRHSELS